MTVLQTWIWRFKNGWQESRPGREFDVPKPQIFKQNEEKNIDYKTQDSLIVRDGGSQDLEPQTFGWSEERQTTRMTIALRSADRRIEGDKIDGRVRMFGYTNESDSTDQYGLDPGESEDAGGLVGEVRAILDSYRKGVDGWDYVKTTAVNDLTGSVRVGMYRADIEVELVNAARVL